MRNQTLLNPERIMEIGTEWMKEALDTAEVEYDNRGVSENIINWENNKRDVAEFLSRSPHWDNDTLSVSKKVFYTHKASERDAKGAFDELVYRCKVVAGDLGDKDAETYLQLLTVATDRRLKYGAIPVYNERVLDKDETLFFEELFGVRTNVGMKWSRLVQAVIKKINEDILKDSIMQRRYSTWVDMITEQKIEYQMTVSVNPADYLLMSYGNSWSSCQIINPDIANGSGTYNGIHKTGTLDYMTDSPSVMVQLFSNSRTGDDLPIVPRNQRVIFFIDPKTRTLAQSRLYPNDGDGGYKKFIMEEVKSIVSEICEDDGEWRSAHVRMRKSGHYHYPDYNSYEPVCAMYHRHGLPAPTEEVKFQPGFSAYCLGCGEECDEASSLYCDDCRGDFGEDTVRCGWCEELFREDDITWIDDRPVCSHCRDEYYTFCYGCEEYHDSDDVRYGPDNEPYCDDCFDREFFVCDDCGNVEFITESFSTQHGVICQSCYQENYFTCDNCCEVYGNDQFHEHEHRFYCDDCYKDIVEESEQQAETA